MFEKLKTAAAARRFPLNRKVMVLAGTVVGGYIAMSILDKVSDDEDLVIVIEEETSVESE